MLISCFLDFDWWRDFPALITWMQSKWISLVCSTRQALGEAEPLFSVVTVILWVHFRTHLTEITGNFLRASTPLVPPLRERLWALPTNRKWKKWHYRRKTKEQWRLQYEVFPPTAIPEQTPPLGSHGDVTASRARVRQGTNVPGIWMLDVIAKFTMIPSRVPGGTVKQETRLEKK